MCVILEEVGYDFRRIFFGLADLLQLSIMRPHTHTHTHTEPRIGMLQYEI